MLPSRQSSRVLPFFVPLLLAAILQGTAQAHGGAVVVNKSGWITLGPSGNSSAIYHQFGFVLAIGDSLSTSYNVSQGSQDAINFQIHDHIGNLTKVFLNVTQSNLQTLFNVTLDGYYMPQWLNPNPHPVSLAYSMATVHPGAMVPIYLQTPFLALAAATTGIGAFIWWRKRRRSGPGRAGQLLLPPTPPPPRP